MIMRAASRWLLTVVVTLSLAFAGGWFVNGWRLGSKIERMKAEHVTEMQQMIDAGAEAERKRNEEAKQIVEKYRADLLAANRRKPRSVYRDPPGCVPATADGTDGADTATRDRRDYGPELRQARDALIRCNALIEAINGKSQ